MDIEKLIERLKAKDFERDYDCTPFECGVFGLLDDAATALSAPWSENKKLMNEPNQFFSGVTARITEQAIEFENRCIGEALSMWQIRKEDVLERIHEADKLQAENEKLRAELEQMKEIMREDGIMVIPSKYPGGPAEWNIPKPNVQKED